MRTPARLGLFSRDWIPIGISQAVAVSCGIAGVHYSTRLVAPEQLGVYGIFLTLVPLGSLLTHAGLIKHFSRHWVTASDRSTYLQQWLQRSLPLHGWLLLAGGLVGSMGILAGAPWIGAAALTLAAALGTYALAFQLGVQSSRRYWLDLGLTGIGSLSRTFFPLLLFALSGAGVAALFAGYATHALIFALAGLLAVRHISPALPETQPGAEAESIGRYQQYFLLGGVLALCNQGMIRWAAGLAFSESTLGHITLAGNLGMVGPNVLAGALWQYGYPRLLATFRAEGGAAMHRAADRMLLVFLGAGGAGCGLLHLLLPWLSRWLIDARYLPALPFVLPLFSFSLAMGGLMLLQGRLLVLDRPRAILRIALVSTSLLAAGTGAAAATGLSSFMGWLWLAPFSVILPAWLMSRRVA